MNRRILARYMGGTNALKPPKAPTPADGLGTPPMAAAHNPPKRFVVPDKAPNLEALLDALRTRHV